MAKPRRKYPGIMSSESVVAATVRDWLDRFLGPVTYTPRSREAGRVDVFGLGALAGEGILTESTARVDDRPGAWCTKTSVWVRQPWNAAGFLIEVELYGWDAWSEAEQTGDRRWLEVPRREMYAECDRRTAQLSAELDGYELSAPDPGIDPAMRAGLGPDQVAELAAKYAPLLVQPHEARSDPDREAWGDFGTKLAAALGAMVPETQLILALAPGGGPFPYVKFAYGTDMLRAEAIRDAWVPFFGHLSALGIAHLQGLGWHDPGFAGDTGPNYWRVWTMPPPCSEITTLAVRTLREAYEVRAPKALRHSYRSTEGADVGALDLPVPPFDPGQPDPSDEPLTLETMGPDPDLVAAIIAAADAGEPLSGDISRRLEDWLAETWGIRVNGDDCRFVTVDHIVWNLVARGEDEEAGLDTRALLTMPDARLLPIIQATVTRIIDNDDEMNLAAACLVDFSDTAGRTAWIVNLWGGGYIASAPDQEFLGPFRTSEEAGQAQSELGFASSEGVHEAELAAIRAALATELAGNRDATRARVTLAVQFWEVQGDDANALGGRIEVDDQGLVHLPSTYDYMLDLPAPLDLRDLGSPSTRPAGGWVRVSEEDGIVTVRPEGAFDARLWLDKVRRHFRSPYLRAGDIEEG